MSASGHSRQSRAASKAGHFPLCCRKRNQIQSISRSATDGRDSISETGSSNHARWTQRLRMDRLKPMRPNKMRGVRINPNLAAC